MQGQPLSAAEEAWAAITTAETLGAKAGWLQAAMKGLVEKGELSVAERRALLETSAAKLEALEVELAAAQSEGKAPRAKTLSSQRDALMAMRAAAQKASASNRALPVAVAAEVAAAWAQCLQLQRIEATAKANNQLLTLEQARQVREERAGAHKRARARLRALAAPLPAAGLCPTCGLAPPCLPPREPYSHAPPPYGSRLLHVAPEGHTSRRHSLRPSPVTHVTGQVGQLPELQARISAAAEGARNWFESDAELEARVALAKANGAAAHTKVAARQAQKTTANASWSTVGQQSKALGAKPGAKAGVGKGGSFAALSLND